MKNLRCPIMLILFMGAQACGQAQDSDQSRSKQVNPDQQKLLECSQALSNSTLVDGLGIEAYQSFLHEDFNRWSAGQQVLDRPTSLAAIEQWWEAGNRVASSDDKLISVQVVGSTGVIRKQVTERFVDAHGDEAGSFNGFITQVWVMNDGNWKMIATTIQRAPDADD